MQHRDETILKKIISEINTAFDMLGETAYSEFYSNEMMKRAVCMTVINIGELVKNLSDEFRAQHKNVPWRFIAGFRDVAAHKYQTLKMADVYKTVIEDFPKLKDDIQNILNG